MTEKDKAFERQQDAQRRAWASLSPLERLRWLQQAKEFTRRWLGVASRTVVRKSST